MGTNESKKECYLTLGSNLGDRLLNLREGISRLPSSLIHVQSLSSIYETEPVGTPEADYFYNMVLKAETIVPPEELLRICLGVESEMGRIRRKRNESRILDIDILFYNRDIIKKEQLEIPHPRMHLRRFVLVPLHEIAPNLIHPKFEKSIEILLKECPDQSEVRACKNAASFLIR